MSSIKKTDMSHLVVRYIFDSNDYLIYQSFYVKFIMEFLRLFEVIVTIIPSRFSDR